jgi:predicted dehydrogenase
MSNTTEKRQARVCKPGEFPFAMVGLDHGHAFGMTEGLKQAGGNPALVFDPDDAKIDAYRKEFPEARRCGSLDEVLKDPSIRLVCCAAVPDRRAEIGIAVLDAGKHYLSDKAPFITREDLARARKKTAETGNIWAVYYSERLQNEAAIHAGRLIEAGAIGTVLNVVGLGPHRLNLKSRPPWFFRKRQYGGILVDLASHQIEQFLAFAGARDARVVHSAAGNLAHPAYPELEDFGDVHLVADNGVTGYFRVDWFTPDGLGTWGDGRVTVLGTDGYMELRKYTDVARSAHGDHIYLVDAHEERHIQVGGQVGFPYFGDLILDCLNGTRTAMDQEYTFRVAELSLDAQERALSLTRGVL